MPLEFVQPLPECSHGTQAMGPAPPLLGQPQFFWSLRDEGGDGTFPVSVKSLFLVWLLLRVNWKKFSYSSKRRLLVLGC